MNINPVSPKEQGGKLKKIQRIWKLLLKLIRDLSLEAIKEIQKYTPAIEFNTNLIEFIKAPLITYWKERDWECTNLLDIKQTVLYCQFGFPLMFYWMRIELCVLVNYVTKEVAVGRCQIKPTNNVKRRRRWCWLGTTGKARLCISDTLNIQVLSNL